MIEIEWKQTGKQQKAWEVLENKSTRELVFGGGAGGGKSMFGVGWLIVMCGQYPRTRWVMAREVLKRLKETTLVTFFDVCRMWGIQKGKHYKYNAIDGTITFTNESQILLKELKYQPSDPNFEDLGSLEITGAFVDEVSEIHPKAVDVLCSRIRYRLDVHGLTPKLLASCNPHKGWVYREFYKPFKEGRLAKDRAFIQALVHDNPFISKHYIDNLQKIRDRATRERLLFGNWEFDDDPSALFAYDTITDLFTNKAKESKEKFISGDVARKGRDLMPIGYWEGLQLKEVHILPYEIKSNTEKSAQWIIDFAERKQVRCSHIVLDEDGVGGGVIDKIGCVGFINNSSAIQPQQAKVNPQKKLNYANLKAQCAFELARLAELGEIGIDGDALASNEKETIIEEFEQVKQKDINRDGKIALISKDIMKEHLGRSPDLFDMVMMRMFFEVKPRQTFFAGVV